MTRADTPTVPEICDALGRSAMAARLKVTLTAISNAAVAGSFPSSWFGTIEGMCVERGMPCPRRLFRFRPSTDDADGAAA